MSIVLKELVSHLGDILALVPTPIVCVATDVVRFLGIASDFLKGRVYEVSLGDLSNTEAEFRKFRLICEEVKGRNCLTNFNGMTFTRDKLSSIVKKWHVSIWFMQLNIVLLHALIYSV